MPRSPGARGRFAGTIVAAAFAPWLIMAFGPKDALTAMNGRWIGPDFSLAINAHTMQGNADERRPFQWEPLFLLDVSGRLVTFAIGDRGYVALIAEDGRSISVTPFGGGGSVILTRAR